MSEQVRREIVKQETIEVAAIKEVLKSGRSVSGAALVNDRYFTAYLLRHFLWQSGQQHLPTRSWQNDRHALQFR